MSIALIPMAVATGVVVIAVAIAVVLVVLVIALSVRGGQKRGASRRAEGRQEIADANERAAAAERDRDVAEQHDLQTSDRDRL